MATLGVRKCAAPASSRGWRWWANSPRANRLSRRSRQAETRLCRRHSAASSVRTFCTGLHRHSPGIDHVGPPLEGRGKAAEGGIEHRAHQQAQRPALELIRNEKFHLAGLLAGRMKDPAVFEPAEGALEILDQDMQIGSVERDPGGEGLADEL